MEMVFLIFQVGLPLEHPVGAGCSSFFKWLRCGPGGVSLLVSMQTMVVGSTATDTYGACPTKKPTVATIPGR